MCRKSVQCLDPGPNLDLAPVDADFLGTLLQRSASSAGCLESYEKYGRAVVWKPEFEVVEDSEKLRPIDIPVLTCDCSLIRNRFGCKPEFSIQQTLLDILNYWRAFEA